MVSDTWKVLRLRLRNHLRLMLGIAVLCTTVAAVCWHQRWLWLPHLEHALYDSALTTFTHRKGASGLRQSQDIVLLAGAHALPPGRPVTPPQPMAPGRSSCRHQGDVCGCEFSARGASSRRWVNR